MSLTDNSLNSITDRTNNVLVFLNEIQGRL